MACFVKLCCIGFLIVLIILLLHTTPMGESTPRSYKHVSMNTSDIIPMNDMVPPDDGPSIMLDEPKKNNDGPNVSATKPEKKIGMNATNAAWYDTVYNGGVLTMLPKGDPLEETAKLYDLNH
jgi:hypothetical protein